jgi:hypothetical protein
MGRILHEAVGREIGRRKGRNRNEEEADSGRRNRSHSRRGRETNKESEKEIRHRGGTECRMDNKCMGQKK